MLIQCTKKLLNELKRKPVMEVGEEPLSAWHANLIKINNRKAVVLVNDKNRYPLVLFGLKAKQFKKFDKHIIEVIRKTFKEACIKDSVIEEYIKLSGEVVYSKTKNRSMVARMNEACKAADFYTELLNENFVYQPSLGRKLSHYMVGDGDGGYIYPYEEMYQDLEDFTGKNILGSKAAVIKVSMDLEKYNIWRRLIIPVNSLFSGLHNTIQSAFGWHDYHLHEFYMYDDELSSDYSLNHPAYHKDNIRAVVNLVSSEEDLAFADGNIDTKLEKGVRLSEYIPARMKYVYDYGDNWGHYIEVEEIIADYDKSYPVCLDGEGNAPPEDVGGEYGYEQFLEVMADKNHPEHDFMKNWAEEQRYKEFDIEEVNKEIKWNYL